jgi:hypothetical protein
VRLTWHSYRYYPYERVLAAREIAALLDSPVQHEVADGIELTGADDSEPASRLTYFAGVMNGHGLVETTQSRLESAARLGKNRQATRYSVHGLHEYKGKFNPQVAKAILNIFGIAPGQRVLDPFCGSGTMLVECAHIGALGYGTDLNPLAVFLANAKQQALATPADTLHAILGRLSASLKRTKRWQTKIANDARGAYLQAWFDLDVLQIIEIVGSKIRDVVGAHAPIFLAIASNLLRDYSLQDPKDLRIRRRKSPLPETPFVDALLAACAQFVERIEATQAVLGTKLSPGQAVRRDVTALEPAEFPALFDAAITSPPYAMALPYIDTQRLSLVWLGLLKPQRILGLEAELIGSRELRGPNNGKDDLAAGMRTNDARLPKPEVAFCRKLQKALGSADGFRRQAVPILLYRYFAAMQQSFHSIRSIMRPRAPFALIVGHNHTVLGGIRFGINTPSHLASIASGAGWDVEELIPLQTYRRYGYHMSNAIEAETLIMLRNP